MHESDVYVLPYGASAHIRKERKRKVYAVRRPDRSLCTQKQLETAALKTATRTRDHKGGQPTHHDNAGKARHAEMAVAFKGYVATYVECCALVCKLMHPLCLLPRLAAQQQAIT